MQKKKLIHIRLSDDIHKKVRIKCAYDDVSIQDYVENLIAEDVAEFYIGKNKKKKPSNKIK